MSTDPDQKTVEEGHSFVTSPDVAALVRDSLNPYVAIGSSLIAILGILGGWPGDHPALVLATFLALGIVSSVLGAFWKKAEGTPDRLILASALTFLPLTAILVVLSGGLDSPMWLLFLVGSLSAAFSNARLARFSLLLTCITALPAMWVPVLLERGFLVVDLCTVAMRLVALIVVWKMTHRAILEVARVVFEISRVERARSKAVAETNDVREQLRHSQKMEALGRLAGGIAHDFNNLLTVILGICSGLREEHEGQQDLTTELDEVLKASERAADLTRQLLVFSRHDVINLSVLDLNEVLRKTEGMLGRLIGEDIHFQARLHDSPLPILANSGELEQVILNLAINARDAMPRGGELTITCASEVLSDKDPILRSGMRPGPYAVLSVADTGTGMTEAIAARVFEPFFTTKAHGTGTGLGLATVYGIISKYKGNIVVDTEPGLGTTFKIVFRVSDDALAPPIEPTIQPTTILAPEDVQIIVVEDSPTVRDIVVRTLARANYRVSAYENPSQLLADAERLRAPFHLLVTDIVMPGMSGVELLQTLRLRNIFTATLFISGYTGDTSLASVETPGHTLLMKPFNQSELLAAVSRILSGDKGG